MLLHMILILLLLLFFKHLSTHRAVEHLGTFCNPTYGLNKRAPAPGAAPRGSQGQCPQQGRQRCTKGSALPPPQPLLPLSPRTPLLLASCCKELVASAATLGLKQVQSLAGEEVGGRVWSWVVGGTVGTRMVWGERSWRELRQSWRCPCSPRKIERGEHSRGSQC